MVSLATKNHPVRRIALTAVLALAAGCSADVSNPPATQVAARVNDEEITVHQINAVLAQNPNLAPEDAAAAKRAILERLIEQKIAVQQALKRKLDRSPDVLQAMEASRADVLARSFADEIARSQPRPSSDEIKSYYKDHPELFSQRRIFTLETISAAVTPELGTELKERIAKSGSIKAVAEWLKSKDVRFAENSGTRGAEEIPLQMLPTLRAMKDGETRIIDAGDGRLEAIRMVASASAPVDEPTARLRIQQFLYNRGLNEAVAGNMRQLKSASKVEYLGEFAEAAAAKGKSEPLQGKQETSREGKAGASAADAQGKTPSEKAQAQQQGTEKGVRGLR